MRAVGIRPSNASGKQKHLLFVENNFEGNPRSWKKEKEQEREHSYPTK